MPMLPADFQTDKLASWTTPIPGHKRAGFTFAGTAKYETTFDAPAASSDGGYYLDLGDVRRERACLGERQGLWQAHPSAPTGCW